MNKEMRITAIGTATGHGVVDNIAQAKSYGRDADFVNTRLGPVELPVAVAGDTAISLAKAACIKAFSAAKIAPDAVGLLIFVSQNPDFGGLPHNAAVLQDELGLPTSAICFDVGLGCSGYVYGLSIAEAMMQRLNVTHALLVTSDQYRKNLKPDDGNTQLLFGDGAAASILSLTDTEGYRYCGAQLGTDGSKHLALARGPDGIAMNGRAVFAFSRKVVPAAIRDFMEQKALTTDDIDQFLLHQGSRAIIEEIANALEVPLEKVPVGLGKTGNTVSSSVPFLLQSCLENPDNKRILLAGFGVGLSWGVALLER